MKILHTSDWHIGRSLCEFSLLEDQEAWLDQMEQVIREHQVDAVIAAGDLFDRSMPAADAVALMDRIFSRLVGKLRVPVLGIAGNHDSPRRIDYGSSLLEASGLYLAGSLSPTLRKVTLHDDQGPVHFFLLPYFTLPQLRALFPDDPPSTLSEGFARLLSENAGQFDWSQRNLLICHGFFLRLSHRGEEAPSLTDSAGQECQLGTSELVDLTPADGFDYIALGHIHRPQQAGRETARYCGSPLRYSLSEAQVDNAFLLLDWPEKGQLTVERIPVQPRRQLRVVSGSFEQVLHTLEDPDTPVRREDYVFANINGSGAILNAMSQLREVFPNALGLQFISQAATSSQALGPQLAELPLEELFSRFYEQVSGEELTPQQQQLVRQLAQPQPESNEKGADPVCDPSALS